VVIGIARGPARSYSEQPDDQNEPHQRQRQVENGRLGVELLEEVEHDLAAVEHGDWQQV